MKITSIKTSTLINIIILIILVLVVPFVFAIFYGGVDYMGSALLSVFLIGIPLSLIYLGLKSFKALICFNVFLIIPLAISLVMDAYKPGFTQVIVMPLFFYAIVLIFINFLGIFVFWYKDEGNPLVLLVFIVLCISTMIFPVKIGHYLRIKTFNKNLPLYEEALELIESQLTEDFFRLDHQEIPEKYKNLAYYIVGKRYGDDMTVSFIWGIAFPVKHCGFAYISDGNLPPKGTDFRKDWPHIKRINDYWFKVSD